LVSLKSGSQSAVYANFLGAHAGATAGTSASRKTPIFNSELSSTYIPQSSEQRTESVDFVQEKGHSDSPNLDVEPEEGEIDVADNRPVPVARAQAFYRQWLKKITLSVERPSKEMPVHVSTAFPEGNQDRSDKIYEDILDLFIYAHHHPVRPDFEQTLFKKWQECDFPRAREASCPDLEIIDKAFNTLLLHHLLLRHLICLMVYLWRTDAMPFIDKYEPRGPGFERFLYGMCWHRYVFRIARAHDSLLTKGVGVFFMRNLADTLLWHWCEFYDHVGEEE
jgi:hypothetical protein